MTQPWRGTVAKEEMGCVKKTIVAGLGCGDAASALSAAAAGQNGVPVGGITRVAAQNDGAARDKVPRPTDDLGCSTATSTMAGVVVKPLCPLTP